MAATIHLRTWAGIGTIASPTPRTTTTSASPQRLPRRRLAQHPRVPPGLDGRTAPTPARSRSKSTQGRPNPTPRRQTTCQARPAPCSSPSSSAAMALRCWRLADTSASRHRPGPTTARGRRASCLPPHAPTGHPTAAPAPRPRRPARSPATRRKNVAATARGKRSKATPPPTPGRVCRTTTQTSRTTRSRAAARGRGWPTGGQSAPRPRCRHRGDSTTLRAWSRSWHGGSYNARARDNGVRELRHLRPLGNHARVRRSERLHPPARAPGSRIRAAGRCHPLSARAQRLLAHRPCEVHLPELRRGPGVRRQDILALRRHQPARGERRVRRRDRPRRRVAGLRIRGPYVRIGLLRAALRVRRTAGRAAARRSFATCRRTKSAPRAAR